MERARFFEVQRLRYRQEAERTAARTEAARQLLPQAARLLRERYGCGRVGVFGSFVGAGLSEGSDIDLYVDAVREGSYWTALADLADLFERNVDLVELEHAPPSLLETIAERGVDVP